MTEQKNGAKLGSAEQMTLGDSILSDIEVSRLVELEAVVERGLQTFYDVGTALIEIRDSRLYRQEYSTFRDYCSERWGFTDRRANQLIDAASVVQNLKESEEVLPIMPQYSIQAEELAKLDTPEKQREAWQRAVETAPERHGRKQMSGAHVQRVVDDMRGIDRTTPPDYPPPDYNDDFVPASESTYDPRPRAQTSKPYHASNRTDSEQWHSKLMWNYKRIDWNRYDHFMISYSKRTQEQLLEILLIAKVGTLVDVRANPFSQYKTDFNRDVLSDACANVGIDYVHIPELGIQSSDRATLHEDHDYDGLFDTYGNSRDIVAILEGRVGLDAGEHIACLCVELDPETCHRSRIAAALEEAGYRIFDL